MAQLSLNYVSMSASLSLDLDGSRSKKARITGNETHVCTKFERKMGFYTKNNLRIELLFAGPLKVGEIKLQP